jgi:ribosomal protein L11 methyltransferase
VPYRIDILEPEQDALDRLVELGAIDAELAPDGSMAALMPDGVAPERVAAALGVERLSISPAVPRDDGSIWVLGPRPVRVGRLRILPADAGPERGAIRLIDAPAFGTGLHPTTALCLDAIDEALQAAGVDAVLDVGTGSGVLALGALALGVPRALGIDIDTGALGVAAENARLNGFEGRLRLARGGPETVTGRWPLVLANVLAGPLIEMAPALVQRVGHQGRLVLSGMRASLAEDVEQPYRHLGVRRVHVMSRAGWAALVLQASW